MRFLIAALSAATSSLARHGPGRQARRLRGRQRRLQERGGAAQPGGRRQVDGKASAQCRLRGGRRLQPHPRQDDREAAGLRQEGRRRRRRAVLLCRPRHRGERHQLSAAGRRRPQIRNGRQARRRHQCRPHARTDHGRCQGQAGVPRCLPRQSVRRKDPLRQGHPQRQRADRPCRNEVRRRHAASRSPPVPDKPHSMARSAPTARSPAR